MKNKRNCSTVLAFSAAIMSSHCAVAAEQSSVAEENNPAVIWSRTDFAPFFILEGEYRNQGISDEVIRLFSDRIQGYQHQPTDMTLGRMLNNARQGVPTCHVALLKTPEREKFIEYSEPVMINYANGIITTGRELHNFSMTPDTIRDIDLESLSGKPLTIMIHQGRSYSPMADRFIDRELKKTDSIFTVKTGRKEPLRVLKQLLAGRLDGFLGRPEEVYFNKISHQIKEPLYLIGIKGQARTALARVGCTRGEWNDSLLEQINQLVLDPEIRKRIDKQYVFWLPEQLKVRYAVDQAAYFDDHKVVLNP